MVSQTISWNYYGLFYDEFSIFSLNGGDEVTKQYHPEELCEIQAKPRLKPMVGGHPTMVELI